MHAQTNMCIGTARTGEHAKGREEQVGMTLKSKTSGLLTPTTYRMNARDELSGPRTRKKKKNDKKAAMHINIVRAFANYRRSVKPDNYYRNEK